MFGGGGAPKILKKQLWIADKGWSSSRGVGWEANILSPKETSVLKMLGLQTRQIL
jgi:hypothetical protein